MALALQGIQNLLALTKLLPSLSYSQDFKFTILLAHFEHYSMMIVEYYLSSILITFSLNVQDSALYFLILLFSPKVFANFQLKY